MKTTLLGKALVVAPAILAACLVGTSEAQADAINENRILRKASGVSKGTLSDVVVTTTSPPNPPVTTNSFDRTGQVKIPNSTGKAKSLVKHDGPEREFDTQASGKVKQAKVSRNGRKIVYKANGETDSLNFFGSGPAFDGKLKAISKIRGKKVVTTANVSGSRTLDDGISTQTASAKASGTGKF